MHLSLTFKILHMQRKTQHNSGKKSLWLPSTNPLWLNCLCELNWEFVISCKWALNRLLFANANIFKLQFLLLCTVHCLVDIRRLGRWGGVESLEQNSYRQGREGFCKFLGTLQVLIEILVNRMCKRILVDFIAVAIVALFFLFVLYGLTVESHAFNFRM